jgi:hypothetical protein
MLALLRFGRRLGIKALQFSDRRIRKWIARRKCGKPVAVGMLDMD